jgi:hypothetical protein
LIFEPVWVIVTLGFGATGKTDRAVMSPVACPYHALASSPSSEKIVMRKIAALDEVPKVSDELL